MTEMAENSNNADFERDFQWYSIEEMNLEEALPYHIGQQMSQNDVISLFDLICGGKPREDFRVGITYDVDQRETEHATDFTAVINCYTLKKANELEKYAHEKGFDTGGLAGNAHDPRSIKVYIYPKGPDTIE